MPDEIVTEVEKLLEEFNKTLRVTGKADFSLLERCRPEQRRQLLGLMNTAALASCALRQ